LKVSARLIRLARRRPMKHFGISKWTDFVRGLSEKLAEVAIGHHLASGSRKCRHTAGMLRKLAAVVRSDLQVQVPEHALRCARAIFILRQPEEVQIDRKSTRLNSSHGSISYAVF